MTVALILLGFIIGFVWNPLKRKPILIKLIRIESGKYPCYEGYLGDGRIVKLTCRFGYLEVFISASKLDRAPIKCIYSHYMEERKFACNVGFDDALYFLKKAGFNINETILDYKEHV